MPDLENAVTTCPLCLGPEEVASMVTVEIDRIVPRGRVVIMICRSCAGAVVLSLTRLDPVESAALLNTFCQPEISEWLKKCEAARGGSNDDSSTD